MTDPILIFVSIGLSCITLRCIIPERNAASMRLIVREPWREHCRTVVEK